VIGFLGGELGDPPGGWPEPFRSKALQGRNVKQAQQDLTDHEREGLAGTARRRTLNELLFPGPTREFSESREKYGDTSVLPTVDWLYGLAAGEEHQIDLEPGKTVLFGLQAIGEPDERGYRTVMATINGQLRPISIRDTHVASEVPATEKADTSDPKQVAAPFQGVVTVAVSEGDEVAAGDVVATIEAMKMEASITAPQAGTVSRVAISGTQSVEGGDLILTL
jgi:pyruvate carboxylase